MQYGVYPYGPNPYGNYGPSYGPPNNYYVMPNYPNYPNYQDPRAQRDAWDPYSFNLRRPFQDMYGPPRETIEEKTLRLALYEKYKNDPKVQNFFPEIFKDQDNFQFRPRNYEEDIAYKLIENLLKKELPDELGLTTTQEFGKKRKKKSKKKSKKSKKKAKK